MQLPHLPVVQVLVLGVLEPDVPWLYRAVQPLGPIEVGGDREADPEHGARDRLGADLGRVRVRVGVGVRVGVRVRVRVGGRVPVKMLGLAPWTWVGLGLGLGLG